MVVLGRIVNPASAEPWHKMRYPDGLSCNLAVMIRVLDSIDLNGVGIVELLSPVYVELHVGPLITRLASFARNIPRAWLPV